MGSWREYLTLGQRREAAGRVPDDLRRRLTRALSLIRQKGAAGESLWSHGHTAEGLRLVRDAFERALAAAALLSEAPLPGVAPAPPASPPPAEAHESDGAPPGELPPPSDDAHPDEPPAPPSDEAPPSLDTVLRRRGLGKRRLRAVLAARDDVARRPLPDTDVEVGPGDAALYRSLTAARRHLEPLLRAPAMTKRELVSLLLGRWAGLLLLVLLLLGGAWWALRTPSVERVRDSGHLGLHDQYAGERVIDGDPDTRWLLPDRATGWVELTLSPPRPIRTVRLLNTSNPPWHDRATRGYRLEVFGPDGESVHASEGEFERLDREPSWQEISMSVPAAARIRFTVKSHHAVGGGLAELEWKE